MAEPLTMRFAIRRLASHPAWLAALLACAALWLTLHQFALLLPVHGWWQAVFSPDMHDVREIVVHDSLLPRVVTCLLSGAMLSLAGAIFQQVLRNPLAESTTLGVSAGASLAMSVALVFAPQWLFGGQQWVALAGAVGATLVVFALASRRRLSPVTLILAGLIVNFLCGSIDAVLTIFHHDDLQSLFIWSAGSLNQNNWDAPRALLPRLILGAGSSAALLRPLTMMSLTDSSARGLGVPTLYVRVAALTLAVLLGASVVASVGVIGFLGMLAPMIVRLAGAHRYRDRLLWAPLFGAALLWFTDEVVQTFSGAWAGVPTGAVMSLLGAPCLFLLLPRIHALPDTVDLGPSTVRTARLRLPLWFGVAVLALLVAIALGLLVGATADGWQWSPGSAAGATLHWRAPRVFAALAAGAALSVAGAIMQRVTRNSMASPEVLGISAGASLGLIALLLLVPEAGRLAQNGAAAAGAFVTLLAMMSLGRRYGFAPERVLLVGVTLGTAFSALVTVLLTGDDSRLGGLLSWMAGSTYGVTAQEATIACVVLLGLGVVSAISVRWLDILPLGETIAAGLGVDLRRTRWLLLLIAAWLTGMATILVGPLGFIGLMAPHLARMLGFRRAAPQLAGAALMGAFVMVLADWLGRNLLFPFQLPVGLVATLLGGIYLMWLMVRGNAAL